MESDEGRTNLGNKRGEGIEIEAGERMNGASKIGRERRGEKEDLTKRLETELAERSKCRLSKK